MKRWRGTAMAAGSAALVGLPAVASAVTVPTPTEGPSPGSHCAVWAPTRTETCFATFAESLRWVGFAGVADDVTLESFFATSAAARPTARGPLSGQRRALDTPGRCRTDGRSCFYADCRSGDGRYLFVL